MVNSFPDAIEHIIETLERALPYDEHGLREPQTSSTLHRRLVELHEHASSHSSIDTFCKKLYIRGEIGDFIKTKILINLILEYFHHAVRPDKRYDAFLASLLDTSPKLPENISILSWNYDQEFERVFSGYFRENYPIDTCRQMMKYCSRNQTFQVSTEEFGFVKLNGSLKVNWPDNLSSHSADIEKLSVEGFEGYSWRMRSTEFWNGLTRYYEEFLTDVIKLNETHPATDIAFAWEDDGLSIALNNAKILSENSNVLVVIGYTFPYFNREIDTSILEGMKNLQKIVLQIPEGEFEDIKGRIRHILPSVEVEHFKSLKLFPLPDEIDVKDFRVRSI